MSWCSKKRRAANGGEGERGTKEKAQKTEMWARRRASGSVVKKRIVKSQAEAVKMEDKKYRQAVNARKIAKQVNGEEWQRMSSKTKWRAEAAASATIKRRQGGAQGVRWHDVSNSRRMM